MFFNRTKSAIRLRRLILCVSMVKVKEKYMGGGGHFEEN